MLTRNDLRQAPRHLNALGERELFLNDLNLQSLQGLDAASDFQALNVSRNEFTTLKFAYEHQNIVALAADNNEILAVASHIGAQLPNLKRLSLAKNRLAHLESLKFLRSLPRLEFVCFEGCSVTKHANYRLAIISFNRCIRWIDYTKVTESERQAAKDFEAEPEQTQDITSVHQPEQTEANSGGQSRESLLKRLEAATSIEEIEEIEALLAR